MSKKSRNPPEDRKRDDGAIPSHGLGDGAGGGWPRDFVFPLAKVRDEMRPKIVRGMAVGLILQLKTIAVTLGMNEIGNVPAKWRSAVRAATVAGDYQAYIDSVADEDICVRVVLA